MAGRRSKPRRPPRRSPYPLVSADFLELRLYQAYRNPRLLERRQAEGLRVIPVFIRPCAWKAIGWLANLQGRPRDGKTLSGLRKYQADNELAELVLEIGELLGNRASTGSVFVPQRESLPQSEEIFRPPLPRTEIAEMDSLGKQDLPPEADLESIVLTLNGLVARVESLFTRLEMAGQAERLSRLRLSLNADRFEIVILGEPKPGKSTLVSALVGEDLVPVKILPCTGLMVSVGWGRENQAILHFRELGWKDVETFDNQDRVKYLEQADIVLFTMSAASFGSAQDLRYINKSIGAGAENIFYIINGWDLVPESHREELRMRVFGQLNGRTRPEEGRIFFISALDALKGRLERDQQRVETSGIIPLEQALGNFLDERCRIKLLQPASELSRSLGDLEETVIPTQRQILEESLAELAERQRKMMLHIDELEQKKRSFFRDLNSMRRQLGSQVQLETRQLLHRLVQEVPRWVNEMETEHRVNPMTIGPIHQQVNQLVGEISGKVYARIKEEVQQWGTQTLEPLLGDWLRKAGADLGEKSQGFYVQLAEVQGESSRIASTDLEQASEVNRVALRCVVTGSADKICLYELGFSQSYLGIKRIMSARRLEEELKKKVGHGLQENLDRSIGLIANDTAYQVDRQIEGLTTTIRKDLTTALEPIRRQAEEVLNHKLLGEARLQERQRLLEEIVAEAAEANDTLRKIILVISEA